jgi:serine/threonine-protein kinase
MSDWPAQIGKYRIDGLLGQGAMGTVYRAHDPLIERAVALKTVRRDPGDAEQAVELVERFRKEAQAAGRLMHPNIVAVYEYGEAGELAYIAMEFVDGTPLSALLAAQPCGVAQALAWGGDLLAALAYSHEHGVVHRDIKPANLLVTRDGAIKITDFGIARIDSSTLTQTGAMLGTPSYMSPEQFRGETIDGRSDVFSAGVVLYQLLTGQRPFSGGAATVMQQVLQHTPPLPSVVNTALPAALDAVLMRALAKDRDQRYPSARDFQLALATALREAPASDDDATILAPAAGLQTSTVRNAGSAPLSPAGGAAGGVTGAIGGMAGVAFGLAGATGGATGSAAGAMVGATGGSAGASAGTLGGTANYPAWLQPALPALEAALTRQIGPMAKLLLRKLASTAADFEALGPQLLQHIPSPQAKTAFQQQLAELQGLHLPAASIDLSIAGASAATATLTPTLPMLALSSMLTPLLAAAIGPIASIVVKRALRQATSRSELINLLAGQIEAPAARARFLAQAADS